MAGGRLDLQRAAKSLTRRALTLNEVLIVISLVVLMLAMLMPSLNSAREGARRVICASNLREWSFAWMNYRDEHDDYLPTEGNPSKASLRRPGGWYNALPPYLGLPSYMDIPGATSEIEEMPDMHVWICPSKNLTDAFKSNSGMNQFHYGMNQVLDGLGKQPHGSRDTPGFPDPIKATHSPAFIFRKKPNTVLMFDIAHNSPAGTPRDVATEHWRGWDGAHHKFHGDYANVLFLGGHVGNCVTDDLVTDRDSRHGDVIWTNPNLYWGYPPPGWR